MAKYKLIENGVKDQENNLYIPNSTGNRHWNEYQDWLAEGNIPDPEYTEEEIQEQEFNEELEIINNEMIEEINKPVLCYGLDGTSIYYMDGKEDSAVRFKHGIEMAELLHETQIYMVDYYNMLHLVSIENAYYIAMQQGIYYKNAYYNRAIKRMNLIKNKG